jgi:hypothetical protein
MALKNPKNCPKTQNQPEIKNLTKMICVFLDNFKVKKKTLMRALFIKRNNLTPISIIFVVEIDSNRNSFLIVGFRRLSLTPRGKKTRKIKFGIKIDFLLILKTEGTQYL